MAADCLVEISAYIRVRYAKICVKIEFFNSLILKECYSLEKVCLLSDPTEISAIFEPMIFCILLR